MAAATRRTTTAKSEVVDFDARRKKKKSKVQPFRAFGKDWKVKPANVTVLVDFEESDSLAPLLAFILGHIVKDEREAFLVALKDEDDVDLEVMVELVQAVQEAAYPDLPTNPS